LLYSFIKEESMLNLNTRKNFNLFKDPFTDDVMAASDVYLNENARFAEEYLYITAKIGGMLALIGESGSGKTTIRRLALDRIQNEGLKIRVVNPRIIDKGRLTASLICDAIIADCSSETPRRTLEAKARQVERILTNSSRSGYSHVLMIEEAHDLSIQTLKYLKRFWEMEDGFKKLLAIVLIGQPEMKGKLDEARNWEAREIIRRMEVLELDPLSNQCQQVNASTVRFMVMMEFYFARERGPGQGSIRAYWNKLLLKQSEYFIEHGAAFLVIVFYKRFYKPVF